MFSRQQRGEGNQINSTFSLGQAGVVVMARGRGELTVSVLHLEFLGDVRVAQETVQKLGSTTRQSGM